MPTIITRSQWGFDGWSGGNPTSVNEKTQRTEFFTHYEGAAHVLSQTGPAVPRAIHRSHKANGWKGIGYGHVVDADGTIFEGRGFNLRGSHCPDHNVQGYSAQIHLGGDERPTDAQLVSQRWLYDEACRRSGRTLAKKGHRDGVATECPGDTLYAWVRAGMPAPANTPTLTGGFLMALTDKQQDDLYARVMGGIPAGSAQGRTDSLKRPARVLDTADGEYILGRVAAAAVDPAKLTADVIAALAALPQGGSPVTDAQLEAALRKVLGSVDEVPA